MQQYLDAAEQDKERYNREFNDYKQTDAYRLFLEKQSAEKQNELKKEKNGTDTNAASTSNSTTEHNVRLLILFLFYLVFTIKFIFAVF